MWLEWICGVHAITHLLNTCLVGVIPYCCPKSSIYKNDPNGQKLIEIILVVTNVLSPLNAFLGAVYHRYQVEKNCM